MLQNAPASGYTRPPRSSLNSKLWQTTVRRKPEAYLRRASVTDVTLLYPEAVVRSSDTFAWHDIRLVHLQHNWSEISVPPSDSHCIMLNLSAPLHCDARLGKRNFEGKMEAGEVTIIPVGTAWSCRSDKPQLSNSILLFLRPLLVRNAVEEFDLLPDELNFTPQIGFKSRHIHHIAMSLLDELTEPNVVGRRYADSLAIALAMQFVRRYGSLRHVQFGHGGMAPHKLRKAIGLIDRHLTEEEEGRVGLRAIAKEIGMSYFHFSRVFKQSMRMTPTNYITERRIERAKKLMEETDLTISEIALRSGFSSQSHFTTSFRRLAGVTPRSFRKAM